jgi:hypothetical protein
LGSTSSTNSGINIITIITSHALKFVVVRTNTNRARTNIDHTKHLRGTDDAETSGIGTNIRIASEASFRLRSSAIDTWENRRSHGAICLGHTSLADSDSVSVVTLGTIGTNEVVINTSTISINTRGSGIRGCAVDLSSTTGDTLSTSVGITGQTGCTIQLVVIWCNNARHGGIVLAGHTAHLRSTRLADTSNVRVVSIKTNGALILLVHHSDANGSRVRGLT